MRWIPKDAVAIVTGASSGIGRHLCELLLERGTRVVGVARRHERLEEIQSAHSSSSFLPVVGDVGSEAVRMQALEAAAEVNDGKLDLLVNNAGIGAIGPFAEASPERLRQIMEVNFFAPAELIRGAIPMLRQGNAPVICNISSVLGHRAVPNKSEYCASKFALHGLSDSIRAELQSDSIAVTLVSPSTTRSEFFDSMVETPSDQPSKRIGSWSPEKVARAALAAIKRRRSEVILSIGGKVLVYADRISPPAVNAVLSNLR